MTRDDRRLQAHRDILSEVQAKRERLGREIEALKVVKEYFICQISELEREERRGEEVHPNT